MLGLDPGFANCGFSLVRLYADREDVVEMGVIRTKKSSAKKNVLATDDNFERARQIGKEIRSLLEKRRVVAICAESMSYPPNASAAGKMAMVWGMLAILSIVYDLPVVQVSPQRIKKAVCGNNDASKQDVEDRLTERYPSCPSLLQGVPESKHEHAFDGLGSIVASMNSDVLLMARRMIT